ncbi:MAG: peptidase [Thermoleophilia bacterium]|nr:peptidase [Thermoleophilia bacterium]
MGRRGAGLAVAVGACALLGVLAPGPAARAADDAPAALPPALVARLEGDRARTAATLAARRRALGRVAVQGRASTAARARIASRAAAVDAVLRVAPMQPPAQLRATLDGSAATIARTAAAARRRLDAATEEAAAAQAAALDADRRLRALQRASATEDDVDTTLGSWRFGSGGPAVSAETLDDYLASKGSPLAGQGAAFLKSGVEHEVDPRFVVAVAGAESYFGIVTCAPHNGWGWGCPSSPFAFRSWAEGIETVTAGLREDYIDDGLESVGEIHLRYAPPDATNDPTDLNYGWADNVAGFLVEQGGDPQDVAGVVGPGT